MKKAAVKSISSWIHRNAREIDIARWNYHFEDGAKKDVIDALMLYQNADGGFGNALDADNWNVHSLPYATLYALNILNEIEFWDLNYPIYKGICKYVDKESNFPDGWTFTVKSTQDFPHADFYNYDEEYNKTESTGIFLGLSSFIIEHYSDSVLYPDILSSIDKYLRMMENDNLGDMGPSGYVTFINAMKRAHIPGYDYDKLETRLKELVNNSIQRKPEQWQYYGYRPSDYIKSPDSIFYSDNRDIVNVELDFLVDTLPDNDVWPISWSWFGNSEIYPRESSISGIWCKANKAIERSLFLRSFGRLE